MPDRPPRPSLPPVASTHGGVIGAGEDHDPLPGITPSASIPHDRGRDRTPGPGQADSTAAPESEGSALSHRPPSETHGHPRRAWGGRSDRGATACRLPSPQRGHVQTQLSGQAAPARCHRGGQIGLYMLVRVCSLTAALRADLRRRTTADVCGLPSAALAAWGSGVRVPSAPPVDEGLICGPADQALVIVGRGHVWPAIGPHDLDARSAPRRPAGRPRRPPSSPAPVASSGWRGDPPSGRGDPRGVGVPLESAAARSAP